RPGAPPPARGLRARGALRADPLLARVPQPVVRLSRRGLSEHGVRVPDGPRARRRRARALRYRVRGRARAPRGALLVPHARPRPAAVRRGGRRRPAPAARRCAPLSVRARSARRARADAAPSADGAYARGRMARDAGPGRRRARAARAARDSRAAAQKNGCLTPLPGAYQPMLRPPSTARIWPVTYVASRTRYSTAPAMSSVEPIRFSGTCLRMVCCTLSEMPDSGQRIAPSATPFTRISGQRSFASARVSIARAAIAAP